MGDILLLGMTHFPRLRLPDEQWNLLFLRMLEDPDVPAHMKDPSAWPENMRREWGSDRGLTAAREQRKALTDDFRIMREELDRFQPDFLLIWGDDQHENFRADGIPAFGVLAYESVDVPVSKLRPVKGADKNFAVTFESKGQSSDEEKVRIECDRKAAKYLATGLIERGYDLTYAYQPRHTDLGHAFLNTILYLGADESGFPWKIVPFPINCYGRIVVSQRGMPKGLSEAPTEDLDPPSPPAWRCFDLGAATARLLAESPYKVAIIASSSWSHAFMTHKHYLLYPDMAADMALYDDLMDGSFESWRNRSLAEIEESGQQEVLNWVCLAGAFDALGVKPHYGHFHETYIFNSPKVFVAGGGDGGEARRSHERQAQFAA
jgi:hypothetical protein